MKLIHRGLLIFQTNNMLQHKFFQYLALHLINLLTLIKLWNIHFFNKPNDEVL